MGVIGCGGGTKGSGGLEVTGNVRSSTGAALEGVEVRVRGTDITAITDESGAYRLSNVVNKGMLELVVVKDGVESLIRVDDLPNSAREVD